MYVVPKHFNGLRCLYGLNTNSIHLNVGQVVQTATEMYLLRVSYAG